VLKVTGGSATIPANFIRVQYSSAGGGTLTVASTTNGGLTFTSATGGTLTGFGNFVTGDTLTAVVDQTGVVYLWKTTAANVTTAIGNATPVASGTLWSTGGGRIGVQLPNGARIDNFRGGDVP
jgi:hypothetical protein